MKQFQNRRPWRENLIIIQLGFVFLSGCITGPTRTDDGAFSPSKEARISPASVQAFADCLLDGFDKAHFMLTNIASRQQRRSNSYRVETFAAGRILLISADVFDHGHVVLNESASAALVNTSGERQAFEECLKKYAIAK